MPVIGEIRRGRDIAEVKSLYQAYIWRACIGCGKPSWVVLAKGNVPKTLRCHACKNRARVQLANTEKERMEELYWGQHKTTADVALILGYSQGQVLCRMARYGIPRRLSSANLISGVRKGSHLSEETKRLLGSYKGERASNWRGGISFEPYSPEFNRELKERIRRRDNYTCQLCGVPQCECLQPLPIHHIDYNKQNTAELNLIALCHGCNAKVNWNRNCWMVFFQRKLEVKYGQRANQKQAIGNKRRACRYESSIIQGG